MTLVVTVPNGAPNQWLDIPTQGQSPLRALLADAAVLSRSSPVYVADYLAANGNDIRSATVAALLANPSVAGQVFQFPAGVFPFVGAFIGLPEGLRNNITLDFTGCELTRDMGGVAGGQQVFFARTELDATHADRIKIVGGKFSLLNCLTSFFGAAFYFESASNCSCVRSEFFCSLAVGVTTGKIRWGLAFLGGSTTNGGGRNNRVDQVQTTLCQIQLCGQGRDVDGILCTEIVSNSSLDFVVSCVSSTGFCVRNVRIDGVVCHDIAGSGVVFCGTDGGTVGGADVIENITIQNIECDGERSSGLDNNSNSLVIFDGGIVTRNVRIQGIDTTLVNAEAQTRSVLVQSDPGEVSWQGLVLADMNIGNVTSNDPLEGLYVAGLNIQQVTVSNVNVRGLRGIRIFDCDRMTISNVTTLDGILTVVATSRNLSRIAISNAILTRSTGFNPALRFTSATGKSMSNVALANLIIDGNNPSLLTDLAGGSMSMTLANVIDANGAPLTAETKAGIIRAVNTPGIQVLTTVSVVVPAVIAGSVGYVDVSMAGTRLATLAVGEAVAANPTADLVAAGVGGGFVNARVSATGVVRCAFVGPLAGGAVNFSFARAA